MIEIFFFFLGFCFFIQVVPETFAAATILKKIVEFVALALLRIVVGENVDKCDRQKTMIKIRYAEVGK